jgi:SAM-dependent MidA family methyltransferase
MTPHHSLDNPDLSTNNLLLCQAIAQSIAQTPQHQITFADYMDLVLYHPQNGYYASNSNVIGETGDFFTSPHLSADFGELLAVQFVEMWEGLNRPAPFTLVEMGAGQGLLIQDILRYLHRHHFSCFEALEYVIVERSPALRSEQEQRFRKLSQSWGRLHWRSWEDILSHSIVGCCFSNELVDALPVHQVIRHQGQLQEIYVTTTESVESNRTGGQGREQFAPSPAFAPLTAAPFQEVLGELSTAHLQGYFKQIGINLLSDSYPDGYRTEVNLAALDWLSIVADRLAQGYILTLDYGYPAHRYYAPTRSQGTLQCYYQHRHHSNPYINIGRQDITAHVDFTTLERHGERCGLQTLGFVPQGLFLMALGLGDRIAALSDPVATADLSINDILHRREALHSLINPMGLGNFGVLIQGKNLPTQAAAIALRGLQALEI